MSTVPSGDLWSQALALPQQQRLQLASELLASVKPAAVFSTDDPDFDQVIAKRQQQLRNGTAMTFSADETIAAMYSSTGKRSGQ